MGDEHDHAGHAHGGRATDANRKRLAITLVLSGGYMLAEAIGGYLTNSLALLADAGHMLSDVTALALSLFALWFARRPATITRTYGFYRTEILAALANAVTLVVIGVFIIIEAYHRFQEPSRVLGGPMMAIAAGGLLVNLAGLWVLNAGKGDSLNVRGAWLHVLTDALGSVGAVGAGLLIWLFGWAWIDPATSVLIALLVVYSSWSLLRQSVAVLMEGTPAGIDVDRVREAMMSVPGVTGVHDLHVWSITSGMDALSAHVEASGDAAGLLKSLRACLQDRFKIDHVTLQIEPAGFEESSPDW